MSDEGPHAEEVPTPGVERHPCVVTQLVRKMAVQGISGVIDMQHRDLDVLVAATDQAVLDDDEPARRVLIESANEVRLRVDMAAEVLDLLVRLMAVDHDDAHRYADKALKRLAGTAAADYLTFFTDVARSQDMLPDKIQEDLNARADAQPWTLPDMLDDRRRWNADSVHLNQVSWRIAQAVGDVAEGATCVEGDVDEQLTRLIAERDGMQRALALLGAPQIAAAD